MMRERGRKREGKREGDDAGAREKEGGKERERCTLATVNDSSNIGDSWL